MLWLAVRIEFDVQATFGILHEFALHVAAKIKVAAVRDAFQLTVFAGGEEREGVFDVGGTDRVVAEFILFMFPESQAFAGEAQVGVPFHAAVAPVLVPLARSGWMAEEFDFHLFELARAEREISRRDFIAKALANLRDAERNSYACAVCDVLEIDKDALSRFRSQKCGILFAAHS